jgi:hypothetical protein
MNNKRGTEKDTQQRGQGVLSAWEKGQGQVADLPANLQ